MYPYIKPIVGISFDETVMIINWPKFDVFQLFVIKHIQQYINKHEIILRVKAINKTKLPILKIVNKIEKQATCKTIDLKQTKLHLSSEMCTIC